MMNTDTMCTYQYLLKTVNKSLNKTKNHNQPSNVYDVMSNQWKSIDRRRPRISAGVSSCGVHNPTNNHTPYRPSN